MTIHILLFFSYMLVSNCKSIFSINTTSSAKTYMTSAYPIEPRTIQHSVTVSSTETTTTPYEEDTTHLPLINDKPHVFQSNFSRNNDSISVVLHSNASEDFVSINNTFIDRKNGSLLCELLFSEHSINSNNIVMSKIVINFNGSLTRDLAIQLGDRLMDIVDLLTTVRSTMNQNSTVDIV
ncbi:hypothetical protein I4U23_020627 [Adineta vaga]|nr:hypothetical protein I4U23_020627 [Adineta vaga]